MPVDASLTGCQLGRFKVEALLGAGGMGAVYRALDTALDRAVAIKVLPPHLVHDESRLRRFVQEAKTASSLNHPNIVTIHDVGVDGGRHFIAMELVDGETLRERMGRRIDVRKLTDIGAQIAEGLSVAHAAGVIHRDLKPENVMVTSNGYAKILDFGLAKLRDREAAFDGETLVKHTTPNAVMGTPSYMSPEQASGGNVDHRSDIFALGCILYEMATGERPFNGMLVVDTLHKIIHEDPRPVRDAAPNAPPELQRIIRKCLAKDPDARYQSAKDVAIDLRELRREFESGSGVVSPLSPRRARSIAIPLATIVLIVIAVPLYVFWRQRKVPPAEPPRVQMTRLTMSGNVIGAAIAPDGKFVAYAYSDTGQQSLWLRQIATGSNLQLLPAAQVGIWGLTFSPDGNSIAYSVKDLGITPGAGKVYEIPTIGGQPKLRVANGVDSSAAFSPDGKRIAFVRNHFPAAAESALLVANADGSGERVLLAKKSPQSLAAFFGGPAWSPDGATIAAPLRLSTSSWKIIGIDAASGQERPLSKDGWTSLGQLVWTPDGKRLMVIGATHSTNVFGTGGPQAQIWSVSIPEGERRAVTTDFFSYRTISISADGASLASVAADAAATMWLAPMNGSHPRRINTGKFDGMNGLAVARDGTIIYTTLESGDSDLWSMDANGENRRQITSSKDPEIEPAASPDGRTIYFAALHDGRWSIRSCGRDGSGEKELCRVNRPSQLDPSPDGKWIYFSDDDGSGDAVWRVASSGGAPERIVGSPAVQPRLSPDGTQLAYYNLAKSAIVVAPAGGGEPSYEFPANPTNYFTFLWSADGKAIIHNGRPNDRFNIWLQPVAGGEPRKVTHFDEQYVLNFDRMRNADALIVVHGTTTRDAVLIRGF